ncbi:MAG: hypothetical protein MPJ50_00995 [Pirellulales bacterium]|nr:hypothetical protein [Pirellulales bacterium]
MTQSPSDPISAQAKQSDAVETTPANEESESGKVPLWHQVKLGASVKRFGGMAGILFVITAVAAVSHGFFSNRWNERGGLREVGDVISQMPPESLASWEFSRDVEISEGVIEMLRSTGHVSRVYQFKAADMGDLRESQITVAVFIGSPGRITAHDPQVCYAAGDFQGIGTRRRIEFQDTGGVSHEFWTMAVSQKASVFQSSDRSNSLIVSHAWGTDGTCTAANYPRLAYLGEPYLYKVQLAMPSGSKTRLEDNRSIEFLKEFLPLLRKTIQQAVPAG